jgi:hypothetical protein
MIVLEIELRMFHLREVALASRSGDGPNPNQRYYYRSALRSQFDKIAAAGRQTAFSFRVASRFLQIYE